MRNQNCKGNCSGTTRAARFGGGGGVNWVASPHPALGVAYKQTWEKKIVIVT